MYTIYSGDIFTLSQRLKIIDVSVMYVATHRTCSEGYGACIVVVVFLPRPMEGME